MSVILTGDIVRVVSHPNATFHPDVLAAAFNAYNDIIETPLQLAHFLAQAAHETGRFRWRAELGDKNYFKKYDYRADLGNNEPGDGYFFRGRGIFMLTGRFNYSKMGRKLDLDLVHKPDMAMLDDIAMRIALQYWKDRDLNDPADRDDLHKITYRVNGGTNGLADRALMLAMLKRELGLAPGQGPFDPD
jgi:putative chitinase